ncbi:M48 family metalloprotease [Natrinema salaciae]|uniref:Heat shock protein HtpX n=1 Tax=Natrinema salaciae TaxID=1186196 RepID=A0A1H9MQC4_9EURY|nr:M48 family metalloprotease [Natrinema salaciae]SER25882.1 heat shock protein HtpX [Natrinema salaciae]
MTARPTGLRARMVAALLGLAVVTLGLLVGVWAVFYGVLSFFGLAFASRIAFVSTAVTLLSIGYLEYRHLETIERLADAQPVDRETAPVLYETTTRVAAQLDVPVPTIAVSERDAPEALAVGFRPESVHLVLSRGVIDALDERDELEAVIAHELAHVRNRDAIVVTAVSLPVVLADGLRSRIDRIDDPGWAAIVTVPLGLLSTGVWIVGRTITARLTRVRERAADRAAAEVTGSPAALASALQRLDREIADTPSRDLRDASGVSSVSILSLEPAEPEKIMLGPEGDVEPSHWSLRRRLHRLERFLFETHPPTDERIESLTALEREQ